MRPSASFRLTISLIAVVFAATNGNGQERRAKAPTIDSSVSAIIFFDDVFAEALQGDRPEALREGATATMTAAATESGSESASGGSAEKWQQIISATTIQDEIKRLNNQLAETVQNVRKFNGGGFEEARRDFTELALLFQIVAKYDGDVRWKEFAYSARDGFARAGFNAKVGTDNSFNEAKARAQDLQELVRGGSIAEKDADEKATWEEIADRPPLMQRLEIAQHERLKKLTASEGEFRGNVEEILHEAEIVSAIAKAIKQEGFEYWDDEDYLAYCDQMQKAAMDLVKAVKNGDAKAGRLAAGEIDKACSSCHESYR